MAVELLTVCEWVGRTNRDAHILQPSWAEVERAIRALDGRIRNDLFLIPSRANPGTYLCIGGGGGRYIATGSIENQEFPTFVNAAVSAEPMQSLVVGGQLGDYPANWIAGLEVALQVAKAFYDAGSFALDGLWTRV